MMCTSIYFRRNYLANVVDSINLDARFDIIYGMCIFNIQSSKSNVSARLTRSAFPGGPLSIKIFVSNEQSSVL